MSRRQRTRKDRRGWALGGGLVLLLIGTGGTALTAGLAGVPAASADLRALGYPSFSTGTPSYDDASGSTLVTFTVTPTAGQVRARVVTATTPSPVWETCSSADGTTWSCPVPGLTAADAAAGTFEWAATP